MAVLAIQPSVREALPGVSAILLDWAGTTIDFGSLAPVQVFRQVFQSCGIEVTEPEARGPMGQAKIDHIRAMFRYDRIQLLWQERYGRPSTEEDVEDLYASFLPLQKQVLTSHAQVIPGIPEAIRVLRQRGLRIGSTTGYTRELMDVVEPLVAEQGYAPEVTICSDEVAAGRPAPWQNFRAAEGLGIYPMHRVLIVDDSVAGIQAGLQAGCWTVAVAGTGNAMGLNWDQYQSMDSTVRTAGLQRIAGQFTAAGAHLVLESAIDMPSLWDGA
jgi:phosphonoacetaldehyde hydrolase